MIALYFKTHCVMSWFWSVFLEGAASSVVFLRVSVHFVVVWFWERDCPLIPRMCAS